MKQTPASKIILASNHETPAYLVIKCALHSLDRSHRIGWHALHWFRSGYMPGYGFDQLLWGCLKSGVMAMPVRRFLEYKTAELVLFTTAIPLVDVTFLTDEQRALTPDLGHGVYAADASVAGVDRMLFS